MRLYTKITINIIEGRTGAYHAATVYVTWPEMMADMHHFEARLCNAGTMRHIVYEWLVRNNLMEYRSGLASIEFRKQGIACNVVQSNQEVPTGEGVLNMEHLFIASDGALYDTRKENWNELPPLRKEYKRHFYEIENLQQLKATLRAGKYTFPGLYQVGFISKSGNTYSYNAIKNNWRWIVSNTLGEKKSFYVDNEWVITGAFIVDHVDGPVFCDDTDELLNEQAENENMEVVEYSVCQDCLFEIAYIDNEHEHDITEHIKRELNGENGHFVTGVRPTREYPEGYGNIEFSWNMCELCKTTLGGSRHGVSLILHKE